MTPMDSDGLFGNTTGLPVAAPAGILGRVDGTPLATEVGEKLLATATSFTNQPDGQQKSAAYLTTVTAGIYDLYVKGIVSLYTGSGNTYELGVGISTTDNLNPNSISEAKANRSRAFNSGSALWTLSTSKCFVMEFAILSVFIPANTTYYANVVQNGAGAYNGDALFYAVRRA